MEADGIGKTADFNMLELETLMRYKRHYKLKGRSKPELVASATKHFETLVVDEYEVMNDFIALLRHNSR